VNEWETNQRASGSAPAQRLKRDSSILVSSVLLGPETPKDSDHHLVDLSHLRDVRCYCQRLAPHFGDFTLCALSSSLVENEGPRRFKSTSLRHRVLASEKSPAIHAKSPGKIPRFVNPMELVENVRMKGREPNPFTPDELLALFSVCEGQQRALYITLALTGLRPSEALGLFREHVVLKGDQCVANC